MKYELYWLPNQEFDGLEKKIGTFDNHMEALDDIENYFKRLGLKVDYMREWKEKNTDITMVDYGSHLHYYAIVPVVKGD